ncbi:ClpXP protease specificity-enhancing factor [Dongshaea marina]|uniref:ClpXP protease specificity-enhancing factor n=1 Tax=Dongshaea marina TaxID=2047966 RepID=UPI001F3D367B
MTPSRPYLLRAFYDWILDNELTPHLLVNAELPYVQVPQQFINDGQIVLNIAPRAVVGFTMDDDAVSFNARFGGVAHQVYVPMAAVMAIQARENGAGTFFPPEPAYESWSADADAELETAQPSQAAPLAELEAVEESADESDSEAAERPKGRPTLRVIK